MNPKWEQLSIWSAPALLFGVSAYVMGARAHPIFASVTLGLAIALSLWNIFRYSPLAEHLGQILSKVLVVALTPMFAIGSGIILYQHLIKTYDRLYVWPIKPIVVTAEWEEEHNIKLVNSTDMPFSGVMIRATVEKGSLDFSKSYLHPSSMGLGDPEPKSGRPFMHYFVGNISPNSTRDFSFKANTGDSKRPAIVSFSISVKSDESLPFGRRKSPK